MKIVFNKPYSSKAEIRNIIDAIKKGKISGDGYYTGLCNDWFQKHIQKKVLLTHSCTAALEMMSILLDAKAGDEVIMPSYTFVSTANAFVLRGIKPVFVDIRSDTLNIDENLIEQAISRKTKAIVTVHYAGVSCEMRRIIEIAKKNRIKVFEDAAQGFGAEYKNKPLGTMGDLGAYSFHETKNIISGEGGCLIINDIDYIERSEIIREKGTNRSKYFRGHVDKYSWVDIGSSYLPSDIIAAYLYAQLKRSKKIMKRRIGIWNIYHEFMKYYEDRGLIKRPYIPIHCKHNAHMYYVIFNDLKTRTKFIKYMQEHGILSIFHYVPLHSSLGGKKYAKISSSMENTNKIADTLARLPIYYELSHDNISYILDTMNIFFKKL